MRDAVPAPDRDDCAACGCGKGTRGVSARRFFARHVARCRGGTELRYGEFTRLVGPIDPSQFRAVRATADPADDVGRITPPTQETP